MTDRAALQDLLERVEKAEGPDREIDAAIWLACFEPTCRSFDVTFHTEYYDNYLSRDAVECDLGSMWVDQLDPPLRSFTADLSSIVQLLRRVRPRIRLRVEALPNGSGVASTYDAADRLSAPSRAATPEIAACAALLRALISQAESAPAPPPSAPTHQEGGSDAS